MGREMQTVGVMQKSKEVQTSVEGLKQMLRIPIPPPIVREDTPREVPQRDESQVDMTHPALSSRRSLENSTKISELIQLNYLKQRDPMKEFFHLVSLDTSFSDVDL